MALIILYLFLMLATLALGGLAIELMFRHSLKSADDRVAQFEQQLKEQANEQN